MPTKHLGLTMTLAAALALTACSASTTPETSGQTDPLSPKAAEMLPESIKASGVLRIGGSYQTAPMTMFAKDGQEKTGLSYELATAAAKQLGVTPEFSPIPFPGQVAALAADKIDMVWDTTSITPERLAAATFIEFAEISYGVIVTDGNPAEISDFKSMCGLNIAVPQGSIFPEYIDTASKQCATDGLPDITTLTYSGDDEARLAVRSGNADGAMSGHNINSYISQTADDGKAFDAVEIAEIESTPIGIQFEKENEQLASAMVEAVNAMIEDGSYAAVFEKYDLPSMQIDSVSIVN